MEGEAAEDPNLFPATVGDKLRAAREAQGLDLPEIAARTRIPQRHLEASRRAIMPGCLRSPMRWASPRPMPAPSVPMR